MTVFKKSDPFIIKPSIGYAYLSLIIFFIVLIIPCYQLIQRLYCPNSSDPNQYRALSSGPSQTKSAQKNTISKLSPLLKLLLTLSILLSFIYNLDTASQVPYSFINHGLTEFQCKCHTIITIVAYIAARTLLYLFFIFRTRSLFNDTIFQYSLNMIYSLTIGGIFIASLIIIPSLIINLLFVNYHIIHDINGNGQFCVKSQKYDNLNPWVIIGTIWIFGAIMDALYQFLSLYLLVSRLFVMIHKQTRFSRLRKRTEDCIDDDEFEPDLELKPSTPFTPPSPNITSFNTPVLSRNASIEPKTPTLMPTDSKYVLHRGKSSSRSIIGKSRTITKEDVDTFHRKSDTSNELIMLISKLSILFGCVIFSSQLAIIMFILLPNYVLIWYSADSCINVFCLWLTFSFTKHYHYKYFCFKSCMKWIFPLIKSAALAYYDDYQEDDIQSMDDGNKEYCNGCKQCICFCLCRKCIDYRNRDEHLEIHAITTAEIDLILNKEVII